MTFLEAQQQARQAFAITSAPGLDTVAKVLQFAVTTEQDRLAAEIAKVEGQNNDLQRALAAERERGDRLAAALDELRTSWIFIQAISGEAGEHYQQQPHALQELFDSTPNSRPRIIEKVDAALAAHRQARP